MKCDFKLFFFMILYMYIAPGQEQIIPGGQNFYAIRKAVFFVN